MSLKIRLELGNDYYAYIFFSPYQHHYVNFVIPSTRNRIQNTLSDMNPANLIFLLPQLLLILLCLCLFDIQSADFFKNVPCFRFYCAAHCAARARGVRLAVEGKLSKV